MHTEENNPSLSPTWYCAVIEKMTTQLHIPYCIQHVKIAKLQEQYSKITNILVVMWKVECVLVGWNVRADR